MGLLIVSKEVHEERMIRVSYLLFVQVSSIKASNKGWFVGYVLGLSLALDLNNCNHHKVSWIFLFLNLCVRPKLTSRISRAAMNFFNFLHQWNVGGNEKAVDKQHGHTRVKQKQKETLTKNKLKKP